jgi:hypothetical protein
MSVVKAQYGTSNQALTITLASLATTAAREGTAVDNTTNLFLDVTVTVKVKTNAAGTSATGFVNVFCYGTADGGTTYAGAATGTDAAYAGNKDSLLFLGSIPTIANATTYVGLFKLGRAFGFGAMPALWGIVIDNESGAAFDATAGNHAVIYQGQLEQVV